MKVWLLNKYDNIRASFWFVPALMVGLAIFTSQLTIYLDKMTHVYNWISSFSWTFTRGPDGSRAVLSTAAGSMMAIASVCFSIMVVALQLASSQFGPRLLRNFMRDSGNQFSLGTFIATFTYCLLVLRTVNDTEDGQFVPHISVTIAITLALMSVGVFIYFIHHAAESIQAETVIAAVSRELHGAIDRLYPDRLGEDPPESSSDEREHIPKEMAPEARPIPTPTSDYLQEVDIDRLVLVAKQRDVVLRLVKRPGEFFYKGRLLAWAWPGDRVDDELIEQIQAAFYFGPRRTLAQDIEFVINQLVEVAVRALSPGINDPFTAMGCVDRLGAALCALAERKIPSPERCDDEGELRVVTDASNVQGMIEASFDQIRQAARRDTSVTLRLLETIATIGEATREPQFRQALRRQADAIHRGMGTGLEDPLDREDVERRYREAIESLEGKDAVAAE